MTWRCSSFVFDEDPPVLMGILNVTPDSFSDGGQNSTLEAALAHAARMLDEGARIIDVGGESTRPGAAGVSADEELARVLPVVRSLSADGVCVSIDTRHGAVARACLEAGASIVNDVRGFRDPEMVEAVRASDCGVVVMHMRGEPATMQNDPRYRDVVDEVRDWLRDQAAGLEKSGIAAERICIDPGPGFGKTAAQTLELVRNFQSLARLGYPTMAALSRKSYLGWAFGIDDPKDRDAASATEALRACELGACVVRTHNVAETARALEGLRPYVFVGMGCNAAPAAAPGEELAGKRGMINRALVELNSLPDTRIVDISSMYESEPAYYLEQEPFLNAVALLRTAIPPKELLSRLHAAEDSLGRVRNIKYGPRTCDLDILDYQRCVADDEELTLPHPRILERDFVVQPLMELRPRHVLANGVRVSAEQVSVGKAVRL